MALLRLKINAGYTQQHRRGPPMPFDVGGLGDGQGPGSDEIQQPTWRREGEALCHWLLGCVAGF